ncbi:MAG: response regulator [Rhodospirillales bacterium]|nr:response regulator [Rhodospirillales bacterium]
MNTRVLIVDDEEDIRSLLSAALERTGYVCTEAERAEQGLEILCGEADIGIVLVDIKMPGMSGLDFIAEANRKCDREIEFVVMTGHGGVNEAVQALRLCASDFLLKPFQLNQVRNSVAKCEENLRLKAEKLDARRKLENELLLKNTRIEGLVQEVDVARAETLETLAIAAEHRDNETGAHIRRIGAFSGILANGLGWSSRDIEAIRLAALLHDVGKIGVPDSILLKPGRLTDAEIRTMQMHTEIGSKIVSSSQNEIMHKAANIALSHHERWDGTGYPRQLRENEIPAEARIVALCDLYDALRSARPYKKPISHVDTVAIILEGDGRTSPEHFDPQILSLFREGHETFAENYEIFSEEESVFRGISENN